MSFPVRRATHFWDPVGLLNLETSRDQTSARCIGRKYNPRTGPCCIRPESSGLLEVIDRLRVTPPHKVTFDQLNHLACLCLCSAYHRYQSEEIATRWHKTVASLAAYSEQGTSHQEQLRYDRRVTELELDLFRIYRETTELGKVVNEDIIKGKEQALRDAEQALKKEVKARAAAEAESTALRAELAAMRAATAAADKAIQSKDAEIKTLQLEAVQSQQAHEELQAEAATQESKTSRLRQTIDELVREAAATTEKEAQRSKDLQERDAALELSQTKRAEDEKRISALERCVSELRNTEVALRASISACWLHRARMWLSIVMLPAVRYGAAFEKTFFFEGRPKGNKFAQIAKVFGGRGDRP